MTELQRLHNVVSRDIAVITRLNMPVDQAMLEDFNLALAEETQRIKDRIMQSVVNFGREGELRTYIRSCQYDLVKLGGTLLRYTDVSRLSAATISVSTSDPTLNTFTPMDIMCHYLYQSISELLAFIGSHFRPYVLWSAWVPVSYLTITRHIVATKLTDIEDRLKTERISGEMISFITGPLKKFLDPQEPVTYGGVCYLLNFQTEVLNFLDASARSGWNEGGPGEVALHELLLMLNYNTRSYHAYYTGIIERTVAAKATVLEKLNVLCAEAKRLRQLPASDVPRYNRHERSFIDMVRHWIREETEDLELICRLTESAARAEGAPAAEEEKTELAISVAVLAASIRALVGSKTLPDENITALARTLSKCFTTLRSGGSFSVTTFRQNYYHISSHSQQTVIEIFQKAILWLKKN